MRLQSSKTAEDAEKVGDKQKAIQKNSTASDMGGLEQLAALVDGRSADKAKPSNKSGVDVKIV